MKKVTVIAPARLHMGFIDLSGSLGRYFGSIGVALNEITTTLSMTAAKQLLVQGPSAASVRQYTQVLCKALKVPEQLQLNITTAIPEHVGLGSGTQMALAIGSALNAYYELALSVREIAQLTERGLRSGIGIGVFEKGGLVVDGGRGKSTLTPPVIAQLEIPNNWRFILIFDQRDQGLYGVQEIKAFKKLPTFSEQETARLCYLLLMQGLPAVVEKDIDLFGEVITQLQKSVGGHFSSVQGGVFTSLEVAKAMAWLEQQGAVAIGQTSWGPTGFCMVDNEVTADALVLKLKQKFAHSKQLSFAVTSVRNQGASVSVV